MTEEIKKKIIAELEWVRNHYHKTPATERMEYIDGLLAELDKPDEWRGRFEAECVIRRDWAIRYEQAEARADALAEALERIGRQGPYMTSKNDYKQGQMDALQKVKEIADEVLAAHREGKEKV